MNPKNNRPDQTRLLMATILVALFLVGCAQMDPFIKDIHDITATGEALPQIEAAAGMLDDIVEHPWDKAAAILLGYGLAIVRRWYKRKKGSKTA